MEEEKRCQDERKRCWGDFLRTLSAGFCVAVVSCPKPTEVAHDTKPFFLTRMALPAFLGP